MNDDSQNSHSYDDFCADCGCTVVVTVGSLEDRGEIEVLCYGCAHYTADADTEPF